MGNGAVRRIVLALVFVLVISSAQLVAPSAQAGFSPGDIGIGDPYFPLQGNGGYNVENYDISVRYDPAQTVMFGETTITAVTTQRLDFLYLDFNGMDVRSVTVDGFDTQVTRQGENLQIPFVFGKAAGSRIVMKIVYDGTPVSAVSRYDYGSTGWMRTMDGIVVASEPNGASKWFPSNNHPSDKATYSITTTVPPGVTAVSNGLPGPTTVGADGWQSTTWKTQAPMSTYLATVAIGNYIVKKTTTTDGVPLITAVGSLRASDAEELDRLGEVIDFLEGYLGPYPNETGGAIVTSDNLGYALETQTRPVYSGQFFLGPNNPEASMVMAHEESHQWFGDRVTLAGWKDVWLNEGFATYMDWLWTERAGYESVDQVFERLACRPNNSSFGNPGDWGGSAGDPGADRLFDRMVYDRGAMTLEVLRRTIGDQPFFSVLKQWAAESGTGPRTTAQFIALAENVSGVQLDDLFTTWLYTSGKPPELTCSTVSVPSAPTSPALTPATVSSPATLTWKTPDSNGGGYITGYSVTATNTSDNSSVVLAETNTYARSQSLATLDPSQSYVVSVTAKNSAGPGIPASVTSKGALAAGTPTVSGSARVGSTLTAAPGSWGPAPVTLAYQWYAGGTALSGATAAKHTLTAKEIGKTLTVRVTGTKSGYVSASRTSAPSASVAAGTITAGTVSISGTAKVGYVLTVRPGTWSPTTALLSYQWSAAGVSLTGATSAAYRLKASDLGKKMAVTVTATAQGYTTSSRTSAATAATVLGTLTAPTPTITGTPRVGSTLIAGEGTWGPGTVTFTYKWYANGALMTKVTGRTYTPTSSSVGKTITVKVTGSKSGYSTVSRNSAPTPAVTN